jgi:hypothetical protein
MQGYTPERFQPSIRKNGFGRERWNPNLCKTHCRESNIRARKTGGLLRFQLSADFFDGNNNLLRCKRRLFLDPDYSPELNVSGRIRSLRVNDRDVGIDCSYSGKFLARKRADDRSDSGCVFWQICIDIAAKNTEWKMRSACDERCSQAGVVVFFNFDGAGPSVLDSVPEAMQQSQARITGPRKNQLFQTAHADHLVGNQIGTEPD